MKIKDKIDIDILTFFKTGKFDFLKLGQSKEWILNNFPDPDDYSADKSLLESNIWCYGNIELHFRDDNTLFLIFSDHNDIFNGGPSLNIHKWVLDSSINFALENFTKQLITEKIDFVLKTRNNIDNNIELTLISSNVKLLFVDNDDLTLGDPNLFKLYSFSLFDSE